MPLFRLLSLFLLMGAIACSDSGDDDRTNPNGSKDPTPYMEIKLQAQPDALNLYNWSEVRIFLEQHHGGISYDSIVWDMPGVFRHVSTSSSYLWMQGLMFSLPGKYTMNATAYHNGDTVSVGSTAITVSENLGDFLGLNWWRTEDIARGDAHFSPSMENYSFFLQYVAEYPYALLEFIVDAKDDKTYSETHASERKLLSDYITQLYGNAKEIYEGTDITQTPLTDEYNSLFRKKLDDIYTGIQYYPLSIWQTNQSNIALITFEKKEGRSGTIFAVIAEPNRD